MTPAAKKTATRRTGKVTGDEENPTASIPGEEPPAAPATRAAGLIPGTELETSPGPQETGATRGARRPVTARLRGSRLASRGIPTPYRKLKDPEQQKAIDELAEQAEEWAAAQKDPKIKPTPVVATRTGFYGNKRRRAGALFAMKIPKGFELPSWVEKAGAPTREDVELQEVVESAEEGDAL